MKEYGKEYLTLISWVKPVEQVYEQPQQQQNSDSSAEEISNFPVAPRATSHNIHEQFLVLLLQKKTKTKTKEKHSSHLTNEPTRMRVLIAWLW